MTPLDFIRQKCIEANPEIVELKFGCEVKLKDADIIRDLFEYDMGELGKIVPEPEDACLIGVVMAYGGGESIGETGDYTDPFFEVRFDGGPVGPITIDLQRRYDLDEETDVAILGRPIRLADVLLAIGEANREKYRSPIEKASLNRSLIRLLAMFNLRQDDINLQPVPTQKFVAELLGYTGT